MDVPRRLAFGTVVVLSGASFAAGRQCQPQWDPAIGQPGLQQVGSRFALEEFGGSLFAGGLFFVGGSGSIEGIARWDGAAWSTIGGGVGGGTPEVSAFALYDDGTGPALYVGGAFTTAGGSPVGQVAKWTGSAWAPLGSGVSGGAETGVHAMIVHDDGAGPALVVAGEFTIAGASAANNIAKWNGAYWSPLGGGVSGGTVSALAVFDDGTGAALYAGGSLQVAGGNLVSCIARWRGGVWSALPAQVSGPVDSFAVLGSSLYAGGEFLMAGTRQTPHIAQWDGSQWSALGAGLDNTVSALAVFEDGRGPALFAGGSFVFSGNQFLNHVARWDGSAWSIMGGGADGPVEALTSFGRNLAVGGRVSRVGNGVESNGVSLWVRCSPCYANCDHSTMAPVLNVNDFICFQSRFAAGDSYANCDGSTTPPVLNVNDFVCFQARFAAGCP